MPPSMFFTWVKETTFADVPLWSLCVALAAAMGVQAKPFKWTSASDIPTWDIHSQNNALGNGVHAAIYDALVAKNPMNAMTLFPVPDTKEEVAEYAQFIRAWLRNTASKTLAVTVA